ncbi:MAG: 2,3-bisphosphoglycerate-dependent phosphoglycerate mutase [Nitrosomonas sp.]|nr:2,3-bisphosphoglycerate-dependent phosphoglycerate mutase [Nitrosomonas sp.]
MSKHPITTQLVLLRHGQSIWNRDKIFTGWSDVELSPKGKQEAIQAGNLLKETGHRFDICFTSELKRAINTLEIVLSTMGLLGLPVQRSWRLNERHYGALEGIERWRAIMKFGIWPVLGCQLGFNASPPPLRPDDPRYPGNQACYAAVNKNELPLAESMQLTLTRTIPYWQQMIVPQLLQGKRVLIVSHKNTLRTLIMQLEKLSCAQVMRLSLATCRPLVYEINHELNPIDRYYL